MNNFEQERKNLNFEGLVKNEFLFLHDFGFMEVESLPTIVRYKNGDIDVNIYHGRQSYEIGLEFVFKGVPYSISEFIRVVNPELAEKYRNPAATESEVIARMLIKISELAKSYCLPGLRSEKDFFAILEDNRKLWQKEYALQTKANQLRPKANEAFHSHNYSKAYDLFKEIKPCLSPSEIKKMEIAEREMKTSK